MTESITSDSAIQAAQNALNGLTKKQEVISQNLANIDTPGYQAQAVDFETTLTNALKGKGRLHMIKSDPAHMDTASKQSDVIQINSRKGGTERADGNNVDIDTELVDMTETVVNYQAMVQTIAKKFALLKQIIK